MKGVIFFIFIVFWMTILAKSVRQTLPKQGLYSGSNIHGKELKDTKRALLSVINSRKLEVKNKFGYHTDKGDSKSTRKSPINRDHSQQQNGDVSGSDSHESPKHNYDNIPYPTSNWEQLKKSTEYDPRRFSLGKTVYKMNGHRKDTVAYDTKEYNYRKQGFRHGKDDEQVGYKNYSHGKKGYQYKAKIKDKDQSKEHGPDYDKYGYSNKNDEDELQNHGFNRKNYIYAKTFGQRPNRNENKDQRSNRNENKNKVYGSRDTYNGISQNNNGYHTIHGQGRNYDTSNKEYVSLKKNYDVSQHKYEHRTIHKNGHNYKNKNNYYYRHEQNSNGRSKYKYGSRRIPGHSNSGYSNKNYRLNNGNFGNGLKEYGYPTYTKDYGYNRKYNENGKVYGVGMKRIGDTRHRYGDNLVWNKYVEARNNYYKRYRHDENNNKHNIYYYRVSGKVATPNSVGNHRKSLKYRKNDGNESNKYGSKGGHSKRTWTSIHNKMR